MKELSNLESFQLQDDNYTVIICDKDELRFDWWILHTLLRSMIPNTMKAK